MRISRIGFFLFSSLLILFSACGPAPYLFLKVSDPDTDCLNTLKPEFEKVLYNTSVDVVGNHLSGLLLIKKMPDGSTRMVFSNEMGMTIFDFEFFVNEFRVLHCIKKLNKKPVIRALKKDLGMIIQAGYNYNSVKYFQSDSLLYFGFPDGVEFTYLITDKYCSYLKSMEAASRQKRKVILNFTGFKAGLPDSVYIAHQAFQFNIALKQINSQDAP